MKAIGSPANHLEDATWTERKSPEIPDLADEERHALDLVDVQAFRLDAAQYVAGADRDLILAGGRRAPAGAKRLPGITSSARFPLSRKPAGAAIDGKFDGLHRRVTPGAPEYLDRAQRLACPGGRRQQA